jgi:hypothetical protein
MLPVILKSSVSFDAAKFYQVLLENLWQQAHITYNASK